MNILIIGIIIHYAIYLIFKPSRTTLSCGLFGWFGKDIKDFNKYKLDILGIFNDSRGGDSCGITVDGEIFIGSGKEKLFSDFLVHSNYPSVERIPSILGHARKSSVGGKSTYNIHPFGFGAISKSGKDIDDVDDERDLIYEFIGAHNGTLHNYEDIAKAFDVEIDVRKSDGKFLRSKIDSEVLLESIYKSKSFRPLSEYNGGAALIWTDLKNPNIVYIFKGASRRYPSSRLEETERPLHYLINGDNSLYVSSMESALFAIKEDEDVIGEFEDNIVYKITDGDIRNATKYKISRKTRHQMKSYTSGYDYGYGYGNGYGYGYKQKSLKLAGTSSSSKKTTNLLPNKKIAKKVKNHLIDENYFDKPIIDKTKVTFKRMRYVRNGVRINGIYTWVPTYGFVYVSYSITELKEKRDNLVGKAFSSGTFHVSDNKGNPFIPFKKSSDIPLFYFYNGIRLLTFSDYSVAVDSRVNKTPFDYDDLSHCAAHPVGPEIFEDNGKIDVVIYKGTNFTGTVSPLGSNSIYTFDKGICTKVISNLEDYTKKKSNIVSTSKEENDSSEIIEFTPSDVENSIIKETLDQVFIEPFKKFPKAIKVLNNFVQYNENALDAYVLLEDFLQDSVELLDKFKEYNINGISKNN